MCFCTTAHAKVFLVVSCGKGLTLLQVVRWLGLAEQVFLIISCGKGLSLLQVVHWLGLAER